MLEKFQEIGRKMSTEKGCLLAMIRRVCDHEYVSPADCPCINCQEFRQKRAQSYFS